MADDDNNKEKNFTWKHVAYFGGGALATLIACTQPWSCSGDQYKKKTSDNIKDKTEKTIVDEDKNKDKSKIVPPVIIPIDTDKKSRTSTETIDDYTDDTQTNKTITIVDDKRYNSRNSTGSNKFDAGEPCVYRHPTDKDLYMRYSGTAGKKKGGSWTENHAGWIRTVPVSNIRDNIFKDWEAIGNMDVVAFYEINGKNYQVNGRPGKETMSDSAVNARYNQNVKTYAKGYQPRSGFKSQRGDR